MEDEDGNIHLRCAVHCIIPCCKIIDAMSVIRGLRYSPFATRDV